NGTRFAYPMEDEAMRPLNTVGNRAFGMFFSWLLGSPVTDSLCGTKAIFGRDWSAIKSARPLFGGHDPWGDFDLLLGAAHAALLRFWNISSRGLLYWDEGKFLLEGVRLLNIGAVLVGGHGSLLAGKTVGTAKPTHALLIALSYALLGIHDYSPLILDAAAST